MIDLPNYRLFYHNSLALAWGVAVYVANESQAEVVSKFRLIIDGCEDIWLELCRIDIFIDVIYRHSKYNIKVCLEEVNKNLEQLISTKLYLVGDININIYSTTNSSNMQLFTILCLLVMFFP